MVSMEPGVIVGAIVTIMVLSYLYKTNPLFRVAEHLLVGLGAGYYAAWGMRNVSDIAGGELAKGNLLYLVPIILGLLFFTRISRKTGFLSRWTIALIIGVSTGLFMRGNVAVQIVQQIIATNKSIVTPDVFTGLQNLLVAVITITVISYFIYTREQTGVLGASSKIGRYGMMIAFGAMFGGFVMSRTATMTGVVQFLLYDFLQLGS